MQIAAMFIAVSAIVAFASAEECKELDLVAKFAPLLSDGNYATCQTDAGYTFYPFTDPPTDTQVTKLCASTACRSLLTSIHSLDLPSCDVTVEKTTFNLKDAVSNSTTSFCSST